MANNLFDGIPIFVNVVKLGGFGAAAEAMGHSNSHVSKVINKLEDRVGVRLLNRTTRSISLTPEGEVFYNHCEQLVSDTEQALQLISPSDEKPKGHLKVSCPLGLSKGLLQPVLSDYLARFPNVTLSWNISDEKVDLVNEGYDLAIRATPALDDSTLICKRLTGYPIYTVISRKYIEKYGRPHHPRELVHHHCICYSNISRANKWPFTDKDGSEFIVDVNERIRSNNGHMELAMAIDGHGIVRLPEFFLKDALCSGEVEILFNDFPQHNVNVYAVYPSRKHLSPKVRKFIELLQEHLHA